MIPYIEVFVPSPYCIAPVLDSLVIILLRLIVSRLPNSAAFALDEAV